MNHKTTNMLMVFCEGSHDVAYVREIFKHCFGFKKVAWKFSDYPSPLNMLFSQSIKNHAAGDLSLDMAHKFFLPNEVLSTDSHAILLFNSGGGTKFDEITKFFYDFLGLLSQKSVFTSDKVIGSLNYLFLYDADSHGTVQAQSNAITNLKTITCPDQNKDENVAWEMGEWTVDAETPFATSNHRDKAIYIWGKTEGKGTLEDLLYPLFERDNSNLLAETQTFIDQVFSWETNDSNTAHAVAEGAKRSKAIFTTIGQRKSSGGSMAVVLNQKELIAADTWKHDEHALRFARFVAKFTGLELVECRQ